MALESGNYIDDLVISNPTGSDPRRQGDDHIRLVKKVLTQSFPNIDGAVTATPADLNKTSDLTNYFPTGGIIMWAGQIANIPAGWALCNGSGTAGGIPIPDLRNRFIIGADADAGGTDDVGDIGGSRNIVIPTTGAHALTIAEMPSHTHSTNVPLGGIPGANAAQLANGQTSVPTTSATGGGVPHSHAGSTLTNGNLPSYYALAYIIKL